MYNKPTFNVSEQLRTLLVIDDGNKRMYLLSCFPKSPPSTEHTLIRHPYGVEPALVGDIPSTVT